MKLTTDENGILLEEVYSGIGLKTSDGEYMGICMRDTGFEFNYQGVWYEAKNGVVKKLNEVQDTVVFSDLHKSSTVSPENN